VTCLVRSRDSSLRATALPRWSDAWFLLLAAQIALGAWVIWSNKAADIATAHVALGAIMLALGITLATISLRLSLSLNQTPMQSDYLVSRNVSAP
jgi:heme A synthase